MTEPNRPLHCLQYTDYLRLEKGGVVRAVLDLSAVLADSGVRVTLATGDDRDAPAAWRGGDGHGAPRVVRLNNHPAPWRRSAEDRAALDRLAGDADVVHLHTPWDPFNLAVAAAARRAGKPYVLTAHGMLDDWCLKTRGLKKRAYLRLAARGLMERAARVHYTAEVEREQSQPRAPRSEPVVLPLIIDLAPFATLPGPGPAREAFPRAFAGGGARLLFVGRLHPIKGLALLTEALAAAEASGEPPHLLLAGPADGSHGDELRAAAERLGVADRVHQLGMVGGDLKHSLYQACDAFVLPSHHENFGIALAEAMLCGAPALLTKSVNIWPEVERLGGLVVERSVAGLAGGIERIGAERESLLKAARENRAAVLDWLDPLRLASEYRRVYEAAIGRA